MFYSGAFWKGRKTLKLEGKEIGAVNNKWQPILFVKFLIICIFVLRMWQLSWISLRSHSLVF
ncbi:MAG: hypothetical protein BHW64_00515 [Candidatus Melainabacteria bacterium LEY3_CP_29_8]|nr:MAG: hypothetical protein BHW64_00515 [Candidatus Melainabacteria bacterium LEY3_CP_29_8]